MSNESNEEMISYIAELRIRKTKSTREIRDNVSMKHNTKEKAAQSFTDERLLIIAI
jgi:hypothetical protein